MFQRVWIGLLLLAALPAAAHHGTLISYDRAKQWTREAVVTSFHFANPHPQLFFDIKNDAGEVEHWAAELLPNPAGLIRNGWTRARSVEALKAGATVKVTIAPSKAGGPVGLLLKVTNMQGEELVTDGGLPPPAAAPPAATGSPPSTTP
jgi:hypothetical protein